MLVGILLLMSSTNFMQLIIVKIVRIQFQLLVILKIMSRLKFMLSRVEHEIFLESGIFDIYMQS